MCQVIHSSIGLWYPTVQFTCKVHNPKTNETIWKSVNVSNFVSAPPGLDKRSCKADEFSITFKSDPTPSYSIRANLSNKLQVFVDISRSASVPGFKIGKGPQGGYSFFGRNTAKPDGYVVHRFWPLTTASGHVVHEGKAISMDGQGMFVHAIQGMRPNLVASAWNFAHFQSVEHGGVSAIQMEFTTNETHGRKGENSGPVTVNVGSIVLAGRLVAVTAETKWPDEERRVGVDVVSRAIHTDALRDSDTGYQCPRAIVFEWETAANVEQDVKGRIEAKLAVDVTQGLVEKVDLLAEIPYVVRMAVNYVAGTKPFMYQWFNPVKLLVKGPDGLIPGLSQGIEIPGHLYNEATFIS